jgi:hypothetical protein
MSRSLGVELREARRRVASTFPEFEAVALMQPRVSSYRRGERPPGLMAVVLAYRSGPREFWGPVLLDLLAPALLASLQRLRPHPPVIDAEDLRQQLVLELLRAAAGMPLPTNPSYLRRRLMARANQGVRRRLEREGRRQRGQRSFEALEERVR